MPRPSRSSRFLPLSTASPNLVFASCFQVPKGYAVEYSIPSHHLLLLQSGRIEADTPAGSFSAETGDLLCFRKAKINRYHALEASVFYQIALSFAPPPRDGWTPNLGEYGPLPWHVSCGPAFDDVRRCFEAICIEITRNGIIAKEKQNVAVRQILISVMSVMARETRPTESMNEWSRLRLRLESKAPVDLDVDGLAREMRLSRVYFVRAFRKHFGLSPREFHARERLDRASELLRQTNKSIKEIAFEVGFTDPRVLAILCRRYLGVAPTELRRGSFSLPKLPTPGAFPMNAVLLSPGTPATWIHSYMPKNLVP